MRTPRLAPLVWLPVWVWLAVGLIAVLVIFFVSAVRFDESPEWAELGIELPEATHFNPWGCNDGRIAIRLFVDRSGAVTWRGRITDTKELLAQVRKIAETRRNPDDPTGWNPSEVSVRLMADRRCPWSPLQRLLTVFTDPDIRIYKLEWSAFVGAEAEHRALPEELHVFLPKGDGPGPAVRVNLGPGTDEPEIRILTSGEEDRLAEIRVHPDVSYGKVVRVVSRLIGDGVETFRFVSP